MYIRDMKTTQGHVSELSACVWHPTDANTFLTAAHDSTCRCVARQLQCGTAGRFWPVSLATALAP